MRKEDKEEGQTHAIPRDSHLLAGFLGCVLLWGLILLLINIVLVVVGFPSISNLLMNFVIFKG